MAQDVALPEPRFVPFGRYLLLEQIAVGGMAEVFLAKRFERGAVSDLLALKRILPSLAEDDDFIRMFLDEARIAARLDHPGIVRIRELGRVGKSHYLAMDHVWGKDLLGIMRRCRLLGAHLKPLFVAWVGAAMCEALDHAHEMRGDDGQPMDLVRRDVSPQNVLVAFDGAVKIIDFGVAKARTRLARRSLTGVLKGKTGYMSPEQLGGGLVDRRSDLFGLGTCLYELCTLSTLFARESTLETMENVKHVRVQPVRQLRGDVPEELERILQRAHAANPDERWQSAREMQLALERFLGIEDPEYGRDAAASWMRDAFRKEFQLERARLHKLDQLGRPQIIDASRDGTASDVMIPDTGERSGPPRIEDRTTLITGAPTLDEALAPDERPTEIFLRYEAEASPSDHVELSPAQIDETNLQRLAPSVPEPPVADAVVERPPMAPLTQEVARPAKRTVLLIVLLVVGGLLLFALGAAIAVTVALFG